MKGTAKIPPIGPVDSHEFQTTPTLVVTEYEKRFYRGNILTLEKWSESLHGINLELYSGATKVAEYSHGTYKEMGTGYTPGSPEEKDDDDQNDSESAPETKDK